MKTILLAPLLLVATGCGLFEPVPDNTTPMMESWMGAAAKDLILKWGPPDKTDTDGAGGNVYTWRKYTEPQRGYDGQVLVAGYTTTYMFWAAQDGKLYNWRYERQ